MIEAKMYQLATEFIETRYPTGWGGAAVIHTVDDRYLISVAPNTANASAELCIETGAICEAHKYNVKITHSLCVVRDSEQCEFKVLTPCGICQERLRYFGTDLLVAVTTTAQALKFVTLQSLQPYHWTDAYPAQSLEHFEE